MSTRILKKISLITTQYHWAQRLLIAILLSLGSVSLAFSASLKGTVETANGTPLCALAIASGQSTFTCAPAGVFSFQDLPLEPDGTIKLQLYADGFYPNVTTLSVFNPQQIVMQPAEICDGGGGGGPLTNKQKTELLIGDWEFVFTVVDRFDPIFSLFGPAFFGSNSGFWLVAGTDDFFNADVGAGWSPSLGEYILIDQSNSNPNDDASFFFQFIDNNNVSGDMYVSINGDFQYVTSFQGRRVSLTSSATALKRLPSSSGSMDFEARLMEELELIYSAKAALNRSSSESTEEASKRAAREAAVERLTEALQAR